MNIRIANNNRRFLCLVLASGLLLAGSRLQAQEIGIAANGGVSGLELKYSTPGVSGSKKLGAGLGVYYSVPVNIFKQGWSVTGGIYVQSYNTEAVINDNNVSTVNLVDDYGAAFQYRVTAKGYEEKQKFWGITVPLLLKYEREKGGKINWYADGGLKLVFPSAVKVKAKASELDLSGYYPDVNALITDLPQHGFGVLNNWSSERRITAFKAFLMLSAETGIKFKLPGGKVLYTGAYFDYGLNKTKTPRGRTYVSYNPINVDNTVTNSLLALNSITQKRVLSFGLALKLGWNIKSKSK